MMSSKIQLETTIRRHDDTRVHLCEWDDGGAWLKISVNSGGLYTALTHAEAQQLLDCLQAILYKEVTA
jgi:hypothetical protein